MIGALASSPPAACPGWVVVVLVLGIVAGVGWLASASAGEAFDAFDRRESLRREDRDDAA